MRDHRCELRATDGSRPCTRWLRTGAFESVVGTHGIIERYRLATSEKVGVPVYLIIMNNALARTGPAGFTTKHRAERLERVARTGGGKVYYVSTEADLGEIFDTIRDELRAHYQLTYSPKPPADDEGEGEGEEAIPRWRPIEVRVNRPGLTARTLAGYEKL